MLDILGYCFPQHLLHFVDIVHFDLHFLRFAEEYFLFVFVVLPLLDIVDIVVVLILDFVQHFDSFGYNPLGGLDYSPAEL